MENISPTVERGRNIRKKANVEASPEARKAAQNKVRDLKEKYKSSIQKEEKAKLANQLEKAEKELESIEEKLDSQKSYDSEKTEISDTEKIKLLKDEIRLLKEKYNSETQKEEKAKLASQLEKKQKELARLEEKLDLKTSERKVQPSEPTLVPPTPGKAEEQVLNNIPEKIDSPEMAQYMTSVSEQTSPQVVKSFEEIRTETLKENPEAKLDHYKEIENYLTKLDPEYRAKVIDLAAQTEAMEKECKLSVCIPVAGHQEGKQIYESLKNYTYQTAKRENFEIVLFVNHPEKDKNGNILNATETLSEIERFKKDHPEIKLRVMYQILPNNEAKIGKIRKLLSDATLVRQHERGEGAPDLIMVSNDADNKGIDPRYVQTFIEKFETDPKADAFLGQLDWDPESYQKFPAIHFGTRLFQYLNIIGRRRSGRMNSSGANSAYRASIYAGIGGYRDDLEGGEDVAIGQAIILARNNDNSRLAFAGPGTRLFTSSRRAIDALNSGLAPVEQWERGFSAFDDEIRKLTMDASGAIDYNEDTVVKTKEILELILNRTLDLYDAGEHLGKDNGYYRKALRWMGIEYHLDTKGDIVIDNINSVIDNIRKYQIEGKLMRDARSGKQDAKDQLRYVRKTEGKEELYAIHNQKLSSFLDRFPDNEQKIGAVNELLERYLDNEILQKLGLGTTVEGIKKQLQECISITDKDEFMVKVHGILKPIDLAAQKHPEVSAAKERKDFIENHKFIPLNEILLYKIDSGDLHLHLAPAADFSAAQKIALFQDAIQKLVEIVSKNGSVREVSATSPLVVSNPGIFTRLGMKIIGPISEQTRRADFESETRPISRASVSREEFLEKYKKEVGAMGKIKTFIIKLFNSF